jgi:hypothetical protein
VEIEGPAQALERFLVRFEAELQPPGHTKTRRSRPLPVQNEPAFAIAASACPLRFHPGNQLAESRTVIDEREREQHPGKHDKPD